MQLECSKLGVILDKNYEIYRGVAKIRSFEARYLQTSYHCWIRILRRGVNWILM